MASLYAELHQSDSATYYFEEAIRCVRQERDQSNLPLMEMAYGRFLVDINEVTQSVPKLEAASAAFEQSNKLVELKSKLGHVNQRSSQIPQQGYPRNTP